MNKTLLLACFLLMCSLLQAQDYLGSDTSFFQVKAKLYQHWLDSKGLGTALRVDKAELKKNGHELELWLVLRTFDPDTAAALWTSAEVNFRTTNPGEELTTVLFETFARMMEIPPAQGNVQVYVPINNGPNYNPCFYVWIWSENGKVQQESRINNCKAQPLNVEVRPVQVKTVSSKGAAAVRKVQKAPEVFDRILHYARQRYESNPSPERNPRVELDVRTDFLLKFHVNDLSKEVLKKEDLSLWCKFLRSLGYECNDMRRERLEFTFYYQATETGYNLSGMLTGKFGSGLYEPRDSQWMDMDPDFEEDFLKPYAMRLNDELRIYLSGR